MALSHKLIMVALATSLLGGCTQFKQMTGQIDTTKLPGQREDILPPEQQQARDPVVTGQPLPPDPMAQKPPALPQGAQAAIPAAPSVPAAPGVPAAQGVPVAPAMPKVPTAPAAAQAGQELITDNGGKAGADCDPKVDLCPQPVKPDPLPPPSPLKAEPTMMAAKTTALSAKATDKKAAAKKKKKPVKKKPAVDGTAATPKVDTSAPPPPGPAVSPPPAPQAQ